MLGVAGGAPWRVCPASCRSSRCGRRSGTSADGPSASRAPGTPRSRRPPAGRSTTRIESRCAQDEAVGTRLGHCARPPRCSTSLQPDGRRANRRADHGAGPRGPAQRSWPTSKARAARRWRRGSRSPARKATSRRTPSTTSPKRTRPTWRRGSSACASGSTTPSSSRPTARPPTPSPSASPPRSSTSRTADVNTWTLVGSTEADLAAGRLSAESPIGRALMDAKVGKPVKVETPKGSRTFVVKKLVG